MTISTIANYTITIDANAVAWYGAIVATASMGITAITAWRDRVQLFVRVTKDMVKVGPNVRSDGLFLQVVIANRGRRPIQIRLIALKAKKTKQTHLLSDTLHRPPIEVREGSSHVEVVEQEGGIDPDMLRFVFVSDGTGRQWLAAAKINRESRLHCNRIQKWLLRSMH